MYNKALVKYIRENGQIVLLNRGNLRWVKMKESLYQKGMQQEEEFYSMLDNKFGLFSAEETELSLKSIYFSVTGKCNMNCTFCSMNSGTNVSRKTDLSIEDIKDKLIYQVSQLKPQKFVISGGEPLMREDIFEILKEIKNKIGNCKIVFQTNGLLLTEEIIDKLAKYVTTVEVSIENIFENPSLQSRMEYIFWKIKKTGLYLSFSFVVDRRTEAYVEQAVAMKRKLDANLSFRLVSPLGRAREIYEEQEFFDSKEVLSFYIRLYKYYLRENCFEEDSLEGIPYDLVTGRSCGGYGQVLAFHADGTAYMCSNFNGPDMMLGNIKEDSLDTIIQHLKNSMLDKTKDIFLVDENGVCAQCPSAYFCPGPCAAELVHMKEHKEDAKCLTKRTLMMFRLFYFDKKLSRKENLENLIQYCEEKL